jgi:hypothetical protein
MRLGMRMVSTALMLLLLFLCACGAQGTCYCARPYAELTKNPGSPYNAVGYLNNGCTAFLIDSHHIVAAAHCFQNNDTGEWQPGLRFYPNFHPDRVVEDEEHVPRGDVTRVVVGSRAGESVLGPGMDWAIARIDDWKDTGGLDMTPLVLASYVPPIGTPLVNPAYTRHHFPYDDSDSVTWDNMEWDPANCAGIGDNNGMWAIRMGTAPIFDGTKRDIIGCNSRWGAGYIHADGFLVGVLDDVVVHNVDTTGGSSGSPIMFRNTAGLWSVIAVGHGGGPTDFSQLNPACSPDIPARHDNVGASVERFRDAPRFASNVAVYRSPTNPSATAVFAVDSDLNKVVYRVRLGSTSILAREPTVTYTSRFAFWKSLGTPHSGVKLTRIAACSADASGRPQVFVVANNASIYTRSVLPNGTWGPWSDFGIPGSAGSVSDIDAATDGNGRCVLFMVADGGGAYVRAKATDTTWLEWGKIASGSYKKITALYYDNIISAAMVDISGRIWQTSLQWSGWTSPTRLSRPAGIGVWRDIDMTWDEAARGFMLAVSNSSDSKLWFTPMYGSQAWSEWRYFETHLWAPGEAPQAPPSMLSVTASRWMEDPAGTTSPVVFATDEDGNVYFVEYGRVGTPGWILDWKSFYHEFIPYP